MTLVRLDADEMYPVYYVTEVSTWGTEVDIPQDVLDKYEKCDQEWHHWQNYLQFECETAEKKKLLESTKQGVPSKGFG